MLHEGGQSRGVGRRGHTLARRVEPQAAVDVPEGLVAEQVQERPAHDQRVPGIHVGGALGAPDDRTAGDRAVGRVDAPPCELLQL